MLLLQSNHHWFQYLPFLGLDTFHLVILKHENMGGGGGGDEMDSKQWILIIGRNNPHIQFGIFIYACVCIYTHTTTYVLHLTYVYIHTHTDKERGETFNIDYHFISWIFEGIVWFTWTSNYYSVSRSLWICSQLHANPSSHFSKLFRRTVCPCQASPTTLILLCIYSSLNFFFREGFKYQRLKMDLKFFYFHSITCFALSSVNTDVWWW